MLRTGPSKPPSASYRLIAPVSAATGAGIGTLWAELVHAANNTSALPGGASRLDGATDEEKALSAAAVKEHLRAVEVRRQTSAGVSRT